MSAGPSHGAAVIPMIVEAGLQRPLHLCGRDHIELENGRLQFERRVVYASEPVDALPENALRAVEGGAVVLIHSPRAGTLFRRLAHESGIDPSSVRIAAISEAAASAAGSGWAAIEAASRPRNDALLELAAKLCKTGRRATRSGG